LKPGSLERSGNVTVRGTTREPGKRRLRTARYGVEAVAFDG
jgi:hypothetical protein